MANVTRGSGSPESDIIDNEKYPKYKGVRKRKWGKWVSEVRLPNSRERIWLGSFETAEKAARAFDAAQFCLRGRCAQFNFPHDPPAIPGGESLSPHEIQAVAARFANETSNNNICTDHPEGTDHHHHHHHYDYMVVKSNESANDEEKSQDPSCCEGETDWSFLRCLDDAHGSGATGANYGNSNYESFDSLFYDNQMHYSGHEFFNPSVIAPQDSDFAGGECHYNGDDSISQQHYSSFLWNF